MIIRIKRRTLNELLIWVLILGPFLMAPLIQFLGLPGIVKYILDVAWFSLLFAMMFKKKKTINKSERILLYTILIFFIFTVINYIVHFQSPLYYLWGFRNNFRGFALFFAVMYFFDENDVISVLSLFDKIFYVNAILMIYQFFVLGYKQDFLGGIFGVEAGCNSFVNLYFCIMTVIYYIQYCNDKKSFKSTIFNISVMLILSAMAELKFYYIEFIVIIAVGALITHFSWKKVLLIIAGVIALVIGYNIFISIFPDIDFSIEGLLQYATSSEGYTSKGDLNRLNFLSVVNDKLLPDFQDRLFGLGLGNCDNATGISALTTPFFLRYESLHYHWMSSIMMYLENGIIGIVLFFSFFITIFISSLKMKKNSNTVFCQISALCAIVAFMNIFYNNSLRHEAGYMLYCILAIPWCCFKKFKNEYGSNKSVN